MAELSLAELGYDAGLDMISFAALILAPFVPATVLDSVIVLAAWLAEWISAASLLDCDPA